MKHIRLFFLATLLLLTSASAWAYDFEVDGIYYNINGALPCVSVTYESFYPGSSGSYSGNVVIPLSVSYGGTTYSVTSIGSYAFTDCDNLTSLTIPSSVTSMENSAFSGCSGLTSIIVEAGNPVYDSRNNCNAIIETQTNTLLVGCMMTVIPNSVTSIGNNAFYYNTNLNAIEIPNSIISIGNWAFGGCTSLTSIAIPESVMSIGLNPFFDCSSLSSILVAGDNPYYDGRDNSNALIETETNKIIAGCQKTVIPNSVTSIGHSAFCGCSGLTLITIPNSVTNIGYMAFENCTGLTSILIPNSVIDIEDYAFNGCTGLTSIVVATGNPKYDSRNNCNAIIETETNTLRIGCQSSSIPNSVTSIGHMAFYNCTGLGSIIIPNSVVNIEDYAFCNCTNLTSITISNSVVNIGNYAFCECMNLTSIIIPNSVTSIGFSAFMGCTGLTSITIGNSVESIGSWAFSGCINLTSVIVKSTTPPNVGTSAFDNNVIIAAVPFFIPCGSQEAYLNVWFWKRLNLIGIIDFMVFSSDETLGRVRIINQPDCESSVVTVVAEPIGDHPFQYWMMNGEIVSTANPYTFVVDEDVVLIGYFEGTGVDEETENKVTVSPNPAMERVRITCQDMKSIMLCTFEGRIAKVFDNLNMDETEIDLADLPKGLYLLRIELQNGLIINKKIIIQ